jgi:type IV fimbrial biogenesis protein FimT
LPKHTIINCPNTEQYLMSKQSAADRNTRADNYQPVTAIGNKLGPQVRGHRQDEFQITLQLRSRLLQTWSKNQQSPVSTQPGGGARLAIIYGHINDKHKDLAPTPYPKKYGLSGYLVRQQRLESISNAPKPEHTDCKQSIAKNQFNRDAFSGLKMCTVKASRGFTLIELLVVVAIFALLMLLVTPSMRDAIEKNAVNTHVNRFTGSLRFARSEAIKSGVRVVMCRSKEPEASAPSCADSTSAGGWASGWIVFVDRDGNTNFDATADTLLRAQGQITNSGGILETAAPGLNRFVFNPTGLMNSGITGLTFDSASLAFEQKKLICISLQGRARVASSNATSCSTTES